MDEFIVWDEARKSFIDYEAINEFYKPSLKDINVFTYIGLNDIDDKKLYANCSIFEFVNYVDRQVYKGYFKYDLFYQRMFVWFFEPIKNNKPFGYDGIGLERVEYLPGIITNLKIIDTILENKLGLIK